jgi:hypothetical protein
VGSRNKLAMSVDPKGSEGRKMEDIERVGTRKSLRNRSKSWKTTDIEKERVENASNSEDDAIEVEPETPQAPRRNRIRRKSTPTITSANTLNEGAHTHGESQVWTTILRIVEELRTKMARRTRSSTSYARTTSNSKPAMTSSNWRWKNSRHLPGT